MRPVSATHTDAVAAVAMREAVHTVKKKQKLPKRAHDSQHDASGAQQHPPEVGSPKGDVRRGTRGSSSSSPLFAPSEVEYSPSSGRSQPPGSSRGARSALPEEANDGAGRGAASGPRLGAIDAEVRRVSESDDYVRRHS
jgi:hypothetical protein